jgi:uncharacterized membrane protein
MEEIKLAKINRSKKVFLMSGVIGLVVSLGLLIEAHYVGVNYPIVYSISSMSYWYYVAHYASIIVLAISMVLILAYVTTDFFSDKSY